MNTLDIIIAALIIIPGVWVGVAKGFIFQAVTLISLYLSAIIGAKMGQALGDWCSSTFGVPEKVAGILAVVLIFIVVFILLSILGRLLLKILKQTGGKAFDVIAGILLGLLKYTLIVGLILLLVNSVNDSLGLFQAEKLHSSKAYCLVRDVTETIFPFIKSLIAGIK